MSFSLPFVKMHGAGNDFIMVDGRHLPQTGLIAAQIVDLCHRRHGIGADGLMVIQPAAKSDHDFCMTYYNADGGEAEMCGNGARCAVIFAHYLGLARSPCRFTTSSGSLVGKLEGDAVSVTLPPWWDYRPGLPIIGSPFPVHHFVNTGVPHLVIPVADVETVDLPTWGPRLRNHATLGADGANVDWVETQPGSDGYRLRTYERGVEDETLACGTGAAAVAVVLCQQGLATSPVTLLTRGGDRLTVSVNLDPATPSLTLRGPAVVSFTGEIELPDDTDLSKTADSVI
jgi:diaminopimelate epimerase